MLRAVFGATRLISRQAFWNVAPIATRSPQITQIAIRQFTSILSQHNVPQSSLLANPKVIELSNNIISRNLIKYSMRKGKRKSVGAVIRRFYRLQWGGWIRTRCGRKKKLWKKSPPLRRRLRQHVLCNATQSTLLDKMVGPYWRKPKYWVDDPYEPYHQREEFALANSKPRPYFPPEN